MALIVGDGCDAFESIVSDFLDVPASCVFSEMLKSALRHYVVRCCHGRLRLNHRSAVVRIDGLDVVWKGYVAAWQGVSQVHLHRVASARQPTSNQRSLAQGTRVTTEERDSRPDRGISHSRCGIRSSVLLPCSKRHPCILLNVFWILQLSDAC